MESELNNSIDLARSRLKSLAQIPAPKSAQRIRFEAEIETIKNKFGSLDDMRKRLGLSRRRVCEYLMVDPSAWTRWTANNDDDAAPAHVYKTMALLMGEFQRDANCFKTETSTIDTESLQRMVLAANENTRSQIDDLLAEERKFYLTELEKLSINQNKNSELGLGWKILLILNSLILLYKLLF